MGPNRAAARRKLTREQVLELRALYRDGMSYWQLSVRYGVSTGTIADIIAGRNYAWIPGAAEARENRKVVRTAQQERRAYIIANWKNETDTEMADRFNVTREAIYNVRHRLGLLSRKPARLRMMATE
jgi:transposase